MSNLTKAAAGLRDANWVLYGSSGGYKGAAQDDGARSNPTLDSWTPLASYTAGSSDETHQGVQCQ